MAQPLPSIQFEQSSMPLDMDDLDAADGGSASKKSSTYKMALKATLISTGQIEVMPIARGWVGRNDVMLAAGAAVTDYHPVGNNNVHLSSYYRGHKISEAGAAAFQHCLSLPAHNLSKQELQGLGEVLRDKTDHFDIFFAQTEDLNGKRILSVEGVYKGAGRTSCKTLYVDADGDGRTVQEISYSARDKDYTANLTEAETSFRSIVWKYEPARAMH